MFVMYRGYRFSRQFDQGQRWDRYAPGLQPGSLLGRRVVSAPRRRLGTPASRLRACHLSNPLGSAGLLFIYLCKLGTTGAGSTLPQDLSDIQWREFRAGLPALAALFLPAAAASRLLQQWGVTITTRLRAYLLLSLAFLGALATPQCVRQRCMLALGSACHSSCEPSQNCAVKNPATLIPWEVQATFMAHALLFCLRWCWPASLLPKWRLGSPGGE